MYWNKWSCKLYLEGKVQLKHFVKKQAMQHIFVQKENMFHAVYSIRI
jgi:hypothetical protein